MRKWIIAVLGSVLIFLIMYFSGIGAAVSQFMFGRGTKIGQLIFVSIIPVLIYLEIYYLWFVHYPKLNRKKKIRGDAWYDSFWNFWKSVASGRI